MPNYLLVAGGLISGAQPWSIRAYAVSGSTESAVQTTWDTAFQAYWNAAGVLSGMPTTTSLTFTSTSTMTANFHQSTKTTNVHAIAGTSAAVALPNQTAFIATLRTALANKAGHGRWYLPAPAVSGIAAAGNLYIAAWMTAAGAGLTALGTALGGAVQLQVFHRNATKSGLAAMSLTPVIGPCDCSNKPAIQRRRGDKIVPTRTAWTS
jgi:hypothetical protein